MPIPWTPAIREFVLAFADDEHLMGQQHTEWIGVAPFLEEDLAFCSIGQDELGHAASLSAIVIGEGDPTGASGPSVDNRAIDSVAFDRNPGRWRSCNLVEMPTQDWAHALVRHWLYDSAEQLRWELISESKLASLAEAAVRAEREEWFHRRHADGLLDILMPDPTAGDVLRSALADLMPVAVGMFDPVIGEAAAIEAGVTAAPFDSRLPLWIDLVRDRFDIDPVLDDRAASIQQHRTVRSEHFENLLSRMCEVLDLDPAAIW